MFLILLREMIHVERKTPAREISDDTVSLNKVQTAWYQKNLAMVNEVVAQFLSPKESAAYCATKEEFYRAGDRKLQQLAQQYDPAVNYRTDCLFSRIHLEMFNVEKEVATRNLTTNLNTAVFLNEVQKNWFEKNLDLVDEVVNEYDDGYATRDKLRQVGEDRLKNVAKIYDPTVNDMHVREVAGMVILGGVWDAAKKKK